MDLLFLCWGFQLLFDFISYSTIMCFEVKLKLEFEQKKVREKGPQKMEDFFSEGIAIGYE